MDPYWMQHFFNYFAKGTVAEGARLMISRKPIELECGNCRKSYSVHLKGMRDAKCPACGDNTARILGGKGYTVKGINII
jgi:Zn finger protein HypA/HybF involved in hydrogenase expression